jgi:hypothetical protein
LKFQKVMLCGLCAFAVNTMPIDYDNFADRLCAFLAAAAGAAYTSVPRAVWRHSAVEADAADPYSVVKIYGGEIPWVSVQVMTVGTSVAAAFGQAGKLLNGLLDAAGRPMRMVVIQAAGGGAAGIRVNAAMPRQPPSLIGRDERGRAEVVFNVDLAVVSQ